MKSSSVSTERNDMLRELQVLNDLISNPDINELNKVRAQQSVGVLLEYLYSDHDAQDAQDIVKYTDNLDLAIEEAVLGDVEYYPYEYVINSTENVRWARKPWDNVLNSEYIYNIPLVGWCKSFTSNSRGDMFKSVIHTYVPVKDDKQSNDWYQL